MWIHSRREIHPSTMAPAPAPAIPAIEAARYDLQKALPAIRDKVRAGDRDGAEADLRALKVPPPLARYYIGQVEHPGPSVAAMKRLPNAPGDVQERVRRDLRTSLPGSP